MRETHSLVKKGCCEKSTMVKGVEGESQAGTGQWRMLGLVGELSRPLRTEGLRGGWEWWLGTDEQDSV